MPADDYLKTEMPGGEIRERFGDWGLERTSFTLTDKDPLCCKMALLQMAWFPSRIGEVIVVNGDSLTKEVWDMQRIGCGLPPAGGDVRMVRRVMAPEWRRLRRVVTWRRVRRVTP